MRLLQWQRKHHCYKNGYWRSPPYDLRRLPMPGDGMTAPFGYGTIELPCQTVSLLQMPQKREVHTKGSQDDYDPTSSPSKFGSSLLPNGDPIPRGLLMARAWETRGQSYKETLGFRLPVGVESRWKHACACFFDSTSAFGEELENTAGPTSGLQRLSCSQCQRGQGYAVKTPSTGPAFPLLVVQWWLPGEGGNVRSMLKIVRYYSITFVPSCHCSFLSLVAFVPSFPYRHRHDAIAVITKSKAQKCTACDDTFEAILLDLC